MILQRALGIILYVEVVLGGVVMHENIIAVIIGIVEGLTEFLPISSTGHMILVGSLLGFEGEKASVFEVFIQLGAILSVLIAFEKAKAKMQTFAFMLTLPRILIK